MGDQVKKISFGFSKLAKKTAIISTHLNKDKQDEVSKLELIDCLEGKSIKLKDPVKLDQGPLIIPLTRPKKEESPSQEVNVEPVEVLGPINELQNNHLKESCVTPCVEERNIDEKNNTAGKESKSRPETLDEIAAREILEELNRKKSEDNEKRVFSVPLTSNAPSGEKESTLEDYDSVPVNEFGMAMLRGMGWAPGKGIGKTEKLVMATVPTPRPKGMGLGADKVIKPVTQKNSNEDLKMVKGSYVRILAGPEKDAYGQIEGFDDESGRLIVKLTLKNVSVSLNEFMIQVVDSNEFNKNSKVINVSKFEKYKEDEVKKEASGKSSQETVQEKTNNRERASDYLSGKIKVLKKKHSSSSEIEEENQKDRKSKTSSDLQMSRNTTSKRTSSRSRSPYDRSRKKESRRSQSRSYKFEPTKHESNTKHQGKSSISYYKKPRSSSSDSSDSSGIHTNRNKTNSLKKKSHLKDRSVSKRRSSSLSSTSSESSSNYSRKKNNKHKNKSSSNKYRSRSRSRSPKKHKQKKRKK